jgi:hypothetical protein
LGLSEKFSIIILLTFYELPLALASGQAWQKEQRLEPNLIKNQSSFSL